MDYTLFRPGYPVSVFIEHFTQREYSQLGAREKAIAFHNQEIAASATVGRAVRFLALLVAMTLSYYEKTLLVVYLIVYF
jgi:hypothetical protein